MYENNQQNHVNPYYVIHFDMTLVKKNSIYRLKTQGI